MIMCIGEAMLISFFRCQ